MNINKELLKTIDIKSGTYHWGWTQLQVVRGYWFAWQDRNGVSHRIDGHDKQDLLDRIKNL